MAQTIEELQDKPYREIVKALADIAPNVLAAKAAYDELIGQQRALIAAREMVGKGARMGDKFRIRAAHSKTDKLAAVIGGNSGGLLFQVLKDGKAVGPEISEWALENFEKMKP